MYIFDAYFGSWKDLVTVIVVGIIELAIIALFFFVLLSH